MMGMRRTMMDAQVTVSLSVLLLLFVEMKNAMGQNPAIPARRIAGHARRRNAGMMWMMIGMGRLTVQMKIARHWRTTGAGAPILCAETGHAMRVSRAQAVRRIAGVAEEGCAGMRPAITEKTAQPVPVIAEHAPVAANAVTG